MCNTQGIFKLHSATVKIITEIIFFNINLPPTASYSTWHFSVTSPHQNSRCISLLPDKAAQQLQFRKVTPSCLMRLYNCSQVCWQKRPCKVRQTVGVRNPPLRKLRVTVCYKGFWTFIRIWRKMSCQACRRARSGSQVFLIDITAITSNHTWAKFLEQTDQWKLNSEEQTTW